MLKLHGDVDEQTDRVLTSADYAKYYGTPESLLCQILRRLFTARPILFLGCSLAQDRWIQLLGEVAQADTTLEHFAIVEYPSTDAEYYARQQFLSNHGITPIWFPHARFDLIQPLLEHLAGSASVPPPTIPITTKLAKRNRLLKGADDPLLAHATGFFGRTHEVESVMQFLRGSEDMATVTPAREIYSVKGAPGIGKSEVCKEALQKFLRENPHAQVYYVELVDARDQTGLLTRLADAFDSPQAGTNDELFATIVKHECLIYLDNLEDILRDVGALDLLRQLIRLPQVRILASSREHLPRLARNIPMRELALDDAANLFLSEWNHSVPDRPLTDSPDLREFLDKDLDCHALSIVLTAAQAYHFASLAALSDAWRHEAMRLARLPHAADKLSSLDISLSRSLDMVRLEMPAAVTLWGVLALFPEGMSDGALQIVFNDQREQITPMREVLLRLNVARLGSLQMLAPLRQFILDKASHNEARPDSKSLANLAYPYFSLVAQQAREHQFDDLHIPTLELVLAEFPNLHNFMMFSGGLGEEWVEKLSALSHHLLNFYQFRVLLGKETLERLLKLQQLAKMNSEIAVTSEYLGDLENRLGEIDAARQHYAQAIQLYTQESANLGLANALKSLGDLEKRLGEIDAARQHYAQAIQLFTTERDNLGLANALQSLGDLELALKHVQQAGIHNAKARELYVAERDVTGLGYTDAELARVSSALNQTAQADQYLEEGMRAAQASNVPSVVQYVAQAASEIHPELAQRAIDPVYVESEVRKQTQDEQQIVDILADIAYRLRMAERFAEAEPFYHRVLELDQDNPRRYIGLVTLLRQTNRDAEALPLAERWLTLARDDADPPLALAALLRKLERAEDSARYVDSARNLVKEDAWYARACIESVAGNVDLAMEYLRRAAEDKEFDISWANRDPDLEWIRNHPKFKEIVDKSKVAN